jgi:hypothetical protein
MHQATLQTPLKLALVALLMALMVMAAPLGSPYIDTARDVYAAWRIASGSGWPLIGPAIGFFTYLGPAWFYVLAVPVLAAGSYAGTAMFVALLGSLKFPLAWYLGSRWLDWRFGLLWAALLAWPGLWMYGLFTFSHFSVIETAVLLFALLAWRDWDRPGVFRAFATGLAFGLMLHAHPTTLVFGLILPVLWWRHRTLRVARGLALALGACALFLPLFFAGPLSAPVPGADTGIGPVLEYLSRLATPQSISEGPVLWWNTVVLGGEAALHLIAAERPWALALGALLLAGLGLLLPAGAAGALLTLLAPGARNGRDGSLGKPGADRARSRVARRLIVTGLLGSLLFAILLGWMRPETAWYWMLGMSPPLTAGLAALLWSLPLRYWRPLAVAWSLAGAVVFLSLLLTGFWETARDGSARHFPTGLMANLKQPVRGSVAHELPWLSFAASDRLGQRICGEPGPIVLHGALGFVAEGIGETPSALRCGRATDLFVSGRGSDPETRHWLGLGPRAHQDLQIDPTAWIGPIAVFEDARPVFPETPVEIASAGAYLSRLSERTEAIAVTLEFSASGAERLVLGNPFYWWVTLRIESVEVAGVEATLLGSDTITRVYGCPGCDPSGEVTWRLRLRMDPKLPADIAFLRAPASAPAD